MAEFTSIGWTDHTFNPWTGYAKLSPACEHCYAANSYTVKARGIKWGPQGTRVKLSDSGWKEPERWNRKAAADGVRRRVFCASLADVYEDWDGLILDHKGRRLVHCHCDMQVHADDVDQIAGVCECCGYAFRLLTMDDLRRDLFALIDRTPNLDWLLLTKRPENVRRMWWGHTATGFRPCYRPNVWLGTTVESSKYLHRIDDLLKVPATVHFVSNEPAFERVDYRPYLGPDKVNWVITGGESKQGKDHQPAAYNVEWARSIIGQCWAAGVSPFVKQLGSNPVQPVPGSFATRVPRTDDEMMSMNLKHPKGEDPEEWPEFVRVQEFPLTSDRGV